MKIWIDIKNSHEPLFFKSLLSKLNDFSYYISCRRFAEIEDLLKTYKIEYSAIGGRPEGLMIKRIIGFFVRVIQLYIKVPRFDVSMNHMSIWSIYVSHLRRKKNITFSDNDIHHKLNKKVFKHVDYLITPNALPKDTLIQDNMREENIYQFNGYKEDIYIADFKPDPTFMDKLPFMEFVTIRPESVQATYNPEGVVSIVPKLFSWLAQEKINVLFLPRYKSDRDYARGFKNVYIPPKPLRGLDVCYYSRAVLTGAGTFAREAACLGTPAVSFFPGPKLLAVDQQMIKDGWMFHSRDPKKIVDFVLNCEKRSQDLSRSQDVQKEVIRLLRDILQKIEDKKKL